MTLAPFDQLLAALASSLAREAGDASGGVWVERAEVSVPLEATIRGDGSVWCSTPRGRWATGFDPGLHRLRFAVAAELPASTKAVR